MNKNITLIGFLCLILASCSNGKTADHYKDDSIRIADSIAAEQAEKAQEAALQQEAMQSEELAKYDKMIAECEAAALQSNKYLKKVIDIDNNDGVDYYEKAVKAWQNYEKKYKEILKVIDNFSPEQFKKVQDIEKKVINPDGYLWG